MARSGNSENSINLTSGAILPGILAMAIPLAASSILQLVFNAADLAVVGNFGKEHSLAAVGSTTALVNLTITLFLGLSIGANALVSRYFGAGDDSQISRGVHSSMLMSVLSGAFLTVVGIFMARPALIWMQSPPETLELATLYLRVYFCGAIPLMVYNFGCSILRAKGDTKRPMYYLAFAGVLNVFLNLLFVIVFDLDVAGVALATSLSQCVSAALVTRRLMREEDAFRLELSKLRLDGRIALEILKIGVPAGFQGIVFALSNVVIQSSVNGFGPTVMAASAASQQIEGFVWLTMNSFSLCVLTFTSQNLGARQYGRIDRVTITALLCCSVIGAALGNLAYYFGSTLLGCFDQDPEVIEAGLTRVYWVCCFYFTCGLMDCIVGSIRGMGYNITPTVVSLLGACGLRIIWIATIFQVPRFHTEDVLFMSYPVSWVVTFLTHCVCYYFMRRRLHADEIKYSRTVNCAHEA